MENIQKEIHETIIHLCKEIKESGYAPDDKAELVKATAQLIEVSKGHSI